MKRLQLFVVICISVISILSTNLFAQMNWTQATANAGWSARIRHRSVVYDNKIWVIGGYDGSYGGSCKNDVWYSTDGVNWTQATANAGWSARAYHTSVVFDNKMWVIGGWMGGSNRINDVWYSTNGVNWTQATANAGWSARYSHTSVVFDNKIWVMGGYDGSYKNDVWYSSDGVNWTQATANAGWSARVSYTSVVFDNKMWVMGGYPNGNPYRNDVWYSSDGVNWTQATASAGWSARNDHTSVVFNNKMWVMGGTAGSGFFNDVWYSSDGVNWTQATANAQWSARYLHASVAFDNKMWVFGGWYDATYRNDVWYSRSITLLSPNGNESWASGTNQIIKWRTEWWCSGFARYRLLLSRNGGSTWTDTISHNVAPTESTYNWLVPVINSVTCRIMVQALDSTGLVIVKDVSDADFILRTTDVSVDSIIQPNGGVIVCNTYKPVILVGNNSFPTTTETCTLFVRIWRYPIKIDSLCNISVNLLDSVIVYDTFKVITINPGQTPCTLSTWHPLWADLTWLASPTYHIIRATARMIADQNSANDSKRKIFTVTGRNYDLQVNSAILLKGSSIVRNDTIRTGTAYNTMSVVSNNSPTARLVFRSYFKIIRVKTNQIAYSRYLDRTLNPMTYACLYYSSGWAVQDTGLYKIVTWIETRPGVDVTPDNNAFERCYYASYTGAAGGGAQGDVTNLPQTFGLLQSAPNPFFNMTTIRYSVPVSGKVTIKLYNTSGRLIETLVNDNINAGTYTLKIDNSSLKIAKGVYFLRYNDNSNQNEIKLIIQ